MKTMPPASKPRLKVRIPFFFEAEGEGIAPTLCTAGLCALTILLIFLAFRLAPEAVVQALAVRG
jgi:hypothetical protein